LDTINNKSNGKFRLKCRRFMRMARTTFQLTLSRSYLAAWFIGLAVCHSLAGNLYPGNFVIASSPGVRSNPCALTFLDLNGDGSPDLICVYYNSFNVTELTNAGGGVFSTYVSPNTSIAHSAILVITNADGHGLVELACANLVGASVTIYTNDFASGIVQASAVGGLGSFPYALASADVNGDGSPDIISANETGNSLSVLTNNGAGVYFLASSPPVGPAAESVAAVDVNGDGWVDLISANSGTNTLTILTNNGSGGFVTASTPAVGHSPQSVIALTNLDGHGLMALVSANYNDGTLTVLTNNGTGSFSLSATCTVGGGPIWVTAADVNGDGLLDLISANSTSNSISVLTNNGSGGFVLCSTVAVGANPRVVTAVDVNSDGHPDLVVANFGGSTLTVLTNAPVLPPPVTGFSPVSGSPGTAVTVTGTNFNSVISVLFNGSPAGFMVNSATQLVATVPSCASTGPLTVANNSGGTVTSSNFTFVKLPAAVSAPSESELQYALCNDSVVTFTFDGTIGITSPKVISSDVVLDGTGHSIVLNGSNSSSLFIVNPGVHLTLTNLTLINGNAAANGGGIENNGGSVVVVNCTFSNNVAAGVSAVSPGQSGGNSAGGAIYNNGGSVIAIGSTFVNNTAIGGFGSAGVFGGVNPGGNGGQAAGGAIGNDSGGTLAITNCTFYGNQAIGGNGGQGGTGVNGSTFTYQCDTVCCAYNAFGDCVQTCPVYCTGTNYGTMGGNGGNGGAGFGGSIYNQTGVVMVVDATFAGGSVTGGAAGAAGVNGAYSSGTSLAGIPGGGGGGNLGHAAGAFVLFNSIVANPVAGGNYAGAPITDAGNNISSDATMPLTSATSATNTSPVLGTLANNGGPTLTMALLPGSPAVRAGFTNGAPLVDQRGQPRKSVQNDIGAYETPIQVSGIAPVISGGLVQPVVAGAIPYLVAFTNPPGNSFSLWSTTNLLLTNWIFIGYPREIAPGQFLFTDSPAIRFPQNFYRVHSP
jgi:hypothetical protein